MDQFTFWMPLLVFALVFSWLMPRPPDCPECGKRLSAWGNLFRGSRRMWCEGGYRCRNCDCETDMRGRKIAAGTPPFPGAVRNRILTTALAGALTIAVFILSYAMKQPIPVPPLQASPAKPPPVVRVDR